MQHSIQEIAKAFSKGEFEKISNHLHENIVWYVVGEHVLTGKQEVVKNCEQTAVYFKTVETDFKINDVLLNENKVIITGTAEFKKNGKRLNYISACDIYEFDMNNKISKITSYCIADKKSEK